MMDLIHSLSGMVTVRLTGADPAAAMADVAALGITVYAARREDDSIDSEFRIRRRDLKKLEALAQRRGYLLRVTGRSGLYWALRALRRRPVLVAGLGLLLLAAMYLPGRVLFIRVEGNETVPTRAILEQCRYAGISFGSSRRAVRSEKVKNALLEALPQLQWAGVNTSGCVATVTVRERSDGEGETRQQGVSSIVAACDGIITRFTVTRGTALCSTGQVVRAGQVLVSGYTDCGIAIQATRAQAEIYAQTQRVLTAVSPVTFTQEGQTVAVEKNYALIIGKKRINFYKTSGISGTLCDKIYSESYLTLPGGFTLPVTLVTEQCTYAATEPARLEQQALQLLEQFAHWYLPKHMVAGQILTDVQSFSVTEDLAVLTGYYACEEMIAQVRSEETLLPYGTDQ